MINKSEIIDLVYEAITGKKELTAPLPGTFSQNKYSPQLKKSQDKFIKSFSKLAKNNRPFITEYELKKYFMEQGRKIRLKKGTMISPLARDFIIEKDILITYEEN